MAQVSAQITVGDSTPTLLWQTSTGVAPDPLPNAGDQIFRAGSFNDPVPIVVENMDASNPIYLGGSTVADGSGLELLPLSSLSFNPVGNDSLYAITASATVDVAVDVQRA